MTLINIIENGISDQLQATACFDKSSNNSRNDGNRPKLDVNHTPIKIINNTATCTLVPLI